MKKFTTYYNDRARKLIDQIEESEGLETIDYYIENNAIGDTMITVTGDKEEVTTLEQIFKMVF